ncbi:MAG: hypothetical protein EOO87_11360 [Pedobacter sp.]|nr:MAG: hypothetical protein EOO87_11360 [Pedobacter sp.]
MKNFFKTSLAAFALVLCVATQSDAQEMTTVEKSSNGMNFKIGIGASGGIPTKSSPFDYALGLDLQLQWMLMDNLALTASGGYTRFMVDGADDIGFIPAIGGVKAYPGIGGMYLTGNVGAGFPIEDGGKVNFVFGGGVGYDWNSGLSLGARYEGWQQNGASSTYVPVKMAGQFALRLGYNFKL